MTRQLRVEEVESVLEQAKEALAKWEVVMNATYTDEAVREGVLINLLKMFYQAAQFSAEIMRRPGESFEEAIGRFVFDATGKSHFPSRKEIDDIVETALAYRRR